MGEAGGTRQGQFDVALLVESHGLIFPESQRVVTRRRARGRGKLSWLHALMVAQSRRCVLQGRGYRCGMPVVRRKSLIQFILLTQGLVIVGIGISLMDPLSAAFKEYANPLYILRGNGNALGAAILFRALPQIVIRCSVAVAVFWWLSQQKELVAAETTDHVFVMGRRTKVAVLCVAAILFSYCAWWMIAQNHSVSIKPGSSDSEPDLVKQYEDGKR